MFFRAPAKTTWPSRGVYPTLGVTAPSVHSRQASGCWLSPLCLHLRGALVLPPVCVYLVNSYPSSRLQCHFLYEAFILPSERLVAASSALLALSTAGEDGSCAS